MCYFGYWKLLTILFPNTTALLLCQPCCLVWVKCSRMVYEVGWMGHRTASSCCRLLEPGTGGETLWHSDMPSVISEFTQLESVIFERKKLPYCLRSGLLWDFATSDGNVVLLHGMWWVYSIISTSCCYTTFQCWMRIESQTKAIEKDTALLSHWHDCDLIPQIPYLDSSSTRWIVFAAVNAFYVSDIIRLICSSSMCDGAINFRLCGTEQHFAPSVWYLRYEMPILRTWNGLFVAHPPEAQHERWQAMQKVMNS